MKRWVAFILFIGNSVLAADELCWTKEQDPKTLQPYSSRQVWQNDRDQWFREQKIQLNIMSLYRAYQTFTSERGEANSLGNDKLAHCYIGCRISQSTNFHTARYVGWLKETIDLTDCHPETHFETKDYELTLVGAKIGKNRETDCRKKCVALAIQN